MSDDQQPREETGREEETGRAVRHDEVLEALRARADWERKQELWETMRTEGVRRGNKPWANAADMHFPLADMQIEKLKPFFIQQVYAGELFANFTANRREAEATATVAAQWFDHQLRHRSNLEDMLPLLIDAMVQNGRAVARVLWNAKRKRLEFEVPGPLDIIVPAASKSVETADWIVLVQTWSVHAYKRAGLFACDTDTLARIRGGSAGTDTLRQDEFRRVGLTYSTDANDIIVWVLHEREGDGWRIHTYSPAAPDKPLRPSFKLAYTGGPFADGAPPFVQFSFEKRRELYHGARGVCEKVAPFEASLNDDWNGIKDHSRLTRTPVFYSPGLKNAANVRMTPGGILPFEVQRVDHPPLPPEIRQGMSETRMVAEQAVGVPDFGTGGFQKPGGNKTATEIQTIQGTMGATVELRARVFRREFAALLRLAWALLVQYAKEERDFRYRDELAQVPDGAFADPSAYAIEPSASGDSFTRAQKIAQAQARLQLLRDDPYIEQVALRRDFLESDTPGLVKRLLVEPQQAQMGALEDQAQELTVMLLGFPALVHPADDHATHLQCLYGFVQRRGAMREPLTEEQVLLLHAHAQQHLQALAAKDKAAAAQFGEAQAGLDRIAQAAAASLQQKQAAAAPTPQPQALPPDAL